MKTIEAQTGTRNRSTLWLGIVMTLVSAAVMLKGAPLANTLPPFILGLLLVVILLWGRRCAVALMWKKMPYADKELTWTFSEEELRCDMDGDHNTFGWKKISRVTEDKDGFFLATQPVSGVWIPKNAFSSEHDLQAFQALVQQKVPAPNA